MAVKLVKNANDAAKKLIHLDSVKGFYFGVTEKYINNYKQTFATDFQNLITKVGIIMSDISIGSPNISYCRTSIDFLCNTVLNSQKLYKEFDKLHINSQGNAAKHTLFVTNPDIKGCVDLYNKVINEIVKKYKLPAFKDLLIVKKSKQQNEGKPAEKGATTDVNFKLSVQLEKGEGRYKKGLFKKTNMINFKLITNLYNPKEYKVKSAVAILKCGKNKTEKKIETKSSVTEFDLPTKEYSGQIEASVIVEYKIGITKTKTIKSTVSKFYN